MKQLLITFALFSAIVLIDKFKFVVSLHLKENPDSFDEYQTDDEAVSELHINNGDIAKTTLLHRSIRNVPISCRTTQNECKLIQMNHTSHGGFGTILDMKSNLSEVRQILKRKGKMNDEDFFITTSNVDPSIEGYVKLNEIIAGNTFHIGATGIFENKEKYADLTDDQKTKLLCEYLNICNGIGIIDGNVMQTNHPLYACTSVEFVLGRQPDKTYVVEDHTAMSTTLQSMQCSGVNSKSIQLSTPIVTAEGFFEQSNSNTRKTESTTAYFTSRLLFNKVHISINLKDVQIKCDFVESLRMAASRGLSLEGYEAVVQVLNEYGWYVIVEANIGGAIYTTTTKRIKNLDDVLTESVSFKESASASFFSYGGSFNGEHKSESERQHQVETTNEKLAFHQIGGTSSGQNDKADFDASLKDPRNWGIISYDKMAPTLSLLKGVDNLTLSKCIRILREYNSYETVKAIQRDINIDEYVRIVALEIIQKI